MSASSAGSPSPGGRIFRVAWAVLGVIAAAQAAAVAMARREPPSSSLVSRAGDKSASSSPADAETKADDPFLDDSALADDPHPEMAVPAGEAPPVPDPIADEIDAPPPVAKPAPLDTPITDEECLVLLERGMDARHKGDMHAAVTDLRAALAKMPNHPRLLYPLASTLDMMAQEAKAKPHWAALFALGPSTGDYYEMARYRLTGEGAAAKTLASGASAATPAEPEEGEGRLILEKMAGEELPRTAEGQIIRFSGTVIRKQDEPVDVAKMGIVIHLFDMVNGRRIDRTTAITPEVAWDNAPVDWTEGAEAFHFEYNQPMMSPQDIVRFGQRKYMGFVMMLYYNDKLQNVASDVPQLLDFAREIPVDDPATPSSELLDAPAPPLPGQPDGALFPGDMVPTGPLR